MNIRIDDDVPLPEPDKPSTWISVSTPTTNREGGSWVEERVKDEWKTGTPGPITEVGSLEGWQSAITSLTAEALEEHLPEQVIDAVKRGRSVNEALREFNKRYPAETTHDAKGVPTVDCYLVGGPLNGKNGPIVGSAKVVELDVYAADGSVSSVELYELGDRGDLGARYWKGTKQ